MPFNKISILLFLALFQGRVVGRVVTEYLGCYDDSRKAIKFKLVEESSNEEPSKRCKLFCFTEGYLHAAIKNGKECRCGDVKVIPDADDESLCNTKCVDDEKCGGQEAFSLHTTGIREDLIKELDDYEIGCLHENEEDRLIKEHKAEFLTTNTPRRCIAYCKALGYPHAGVQLQRECFCGLSRKTYPVVSGCSIVCSGDRKQMCGGYWKMNLYTTGVTKPAPALAQRGCFERTSIKVSLTKNIDEMIPNKCISHCYLNGQNFAHIYNGSTCLCSYALPMSKYKGNQNINCGIKCAGNQDEKCGGENFAISYSTGVSTNPILGKLLGCFKDEKGDLMSGSKQILKHDNSVEKCIYICMVKGYAFAGLRNKNECECTKSRPKRNLGTMVPDIYCKMPCPKNLLQSCGTPLHVFLYRTGVQPSIEDDCIKSESIANRKNTCSGQTLFEDDFSSLDENKWQHSVKISGEDEEFVVYTSKRKNTFTSNGKLNIRPSIMPEKFIHNGLLHLKGCTEDEDSVHCKKRANNFNIIPPIESGQICSKQSFNFIYGNITVVAKLPKGDWLVPQVWLKPTNENYGPGYMSGKLLILNSRGNPTLTDNNQKDISAHIVESGFQVATSKHSNIVTSTVSVTSTVPLYDDFVKYHVVWSPGKVQFYVNSAIVSGFRTIFDYSGFTLLDEMDVDDSYIDKKKTNTAPFDEVKKTNMAPFDEEFHICIGLYVGGRVNFPDNSLTKDGILKPWKNKEVKGQLNFWLKRKDWLSTWSNETVFKVDSIQVTAL